MTLTFASVRSTARRYRVQAMGVGTALFAIVPAMLLGVGARHRVAALRTEQRRLESDSAEIANFRSHFRAAPGEQELRGLPDTLAIAVSRDMRVSLAETIASRAEHLGLRDVRVRFSSPDSASPPARPELTSKDAAIAVADYDLSIDCGGDYAAVLSLIGQLPTSVALQRLIAVRGVRGGEYHLSLAVFENAKASATGSANGVNQHG